MRYFFLWTALFFFRFAGLPAQSLSPRQEHMQRLYKQAKEYMVQGNYPEANARFRQALSLKEKMPADLCYFFAETLFQVRQFKNSENFIDKYFELTREDGKYFREARALKKKLGDRLRAIRNCAACDAEGYRLDACAHCDENGQTAYSCGYCSGTGHLLCPDCQGEGILIVKNERQENRYKTCGRCSSRGFIECPRCQGAKQLVGKCPLCQGTKKTRGAAICPHEKAPAAETERTGKTEGTEKTGD